MDPTPATMLPFAGPRSTRGSTLRWRIACLAGAAIAISYLDRQTLPVAIKAIQKDIPISNEAFSHLNTAFLATYGVMYAAGGKLVDALGTRTGFTCIMIFWSLACASHGLAGTVGMLVVSRLLLGMGEGGGFPASTRAVTEWFPAEERSSAMGIINAGTAVGAVVAPLLIALILGYTNWRVIFFITGGLGLAWTFLWWRMYFPPELHPGLSGEERQALAASLAPAAHELRPPRWLELLRFRETWGLVTAKFLSDAAWYFYLFWLPKYLYDARGFDTKSVGAFAWIPYAASGIGCLAGGWLSSHLVKSRGSINLSRKIALGASAALMPFVVLVTRAPVGWALLLFSLAYFGQQSWSTLVMVLPADIFPKQSVGSVAGLVGFGGAMGGIVFGECAGYLLDHGYGYSVVLGLAASFHILAFAVICLAIPNIHRLKIQSNPTP
jgi:ACS family hexuronate transporter-like MFS transporter